MNKRGLYVINEAVFHCAASPHDYHDDISVIEEWHKESEKDFMPTPEGVYCGYHIYIKMDGTRQYGRPLHWFGQHVSGRNWTTVGICFGGMGGIKGTITPEQYEEAKVVLMDLKAELPRLNKASQHSDHEPDRKPDCAGLTKSQLIQLNNLLSL